MAAHYPPWEPDTFGPLHSRNTRKRAGQINRNASPGSGFGSSLISTEELDRRREEQAQERRALGAGVTLDFRDDPDDAESAAVPLGRQTLAGDAEAKKRAILARLRASPAGVEVRTLVGVGGATAEDVDNIIGLFTDEDSGEQLAEEIAQGWVKPYDYGGVDDDGFGDAEGEDDELDDDDVDQADLVNTYYIANSHRDSIGCKMQDVQRAMGIPLPRLRRFVDFLLSEGEIVETLEGHKSTHDPPSPRPTSRPRRAAAAASPRPTSRPRPAAGAVRDKRYYRESKKRSNEAMERATGKTAHERATDEARREGYESMGVKRKATAQEEGYENHVEKSAKNAGFETINDYHAACAKKLGYATRHEATKAAAVKLPGITSTEERWIKNSYSKYIGVKDWKALVADVGLAAALRKFAKSDFPKTHSQLKKARKEGRFSRS